jgi:hypothetical protein
MFGRYNSKNTINVSMHEMRTWPCISCGQHLYGISRNVALQTVMDSTVHEPRCDLRPCTFDALSQVLGLLATVQLRRPDHCDALVAHPHFLEHIVDAMRAHESHAGVMRQGCQLVRNLVVRNTHLRAAVLALGVEGLMRRAKKLTDCDDVAAAALRDLGIDNYKD